MQALRLACRSGGQWAVAAAARRCWAAPARPLPSAVQVRAAATTTKNKSSSSKRKSRKAAAKAAEEQPPEPPPPPPELFQLLPRETLLFPELLTPGARAVLLGIDPDIQGAVAVLSWRNLPVQGSSSSSGSSGGSSGEAGSSSACSGGTDSGSSGASLPALADLELAVHDMPVEVWEQTNRSKKHPCAATLASLLRHYLDGGGQSAAASSDSSGESSGSLEPQSSSCSGASGSDSSSSSSSSSTSATQQLGGAAADEGPPVVRAVVEYTTPQHLSGKHAWYGIGFSTGLLNGLLVSLGLPYQRVHASVWKKQMGLFRQGKEGSLALARQAFHPAGAPLLRRKKDHGRAEALLLAAYGLGVRAAPLAPLPGAESAAEEADAEEQSEAQGEEAGSDAEAEEGSTAAGRRKAAAKKRGRLLDDELIQIST